MSRREYLCGENFRGSTLCTVPIMNQLLLIYPYPVVERQHDPRDQILAAIRGNINRPQLIAHTPLELAVMMSQCHVSHPLPNALHEALDSCDAYTFAKNEMPPLHKVPGIYKYRNEFPHYDQEAVNDDLHHSGRLVHSGQVVFHGGEWPKHDNMPILNEILTLDRPFSTTLCPQVATTHAYYHNGHGYIWVITAAHNISTPAYVFHNKKRQNLKHEMEILFAPGAQVKCTSIIPVANRPTVLEVILQ